MDSLDTLLDFEGTYNIQYKVTGVEDGGTKLILEPSISFPYYYPEYIEGGALSKTSKTPGYINIKLLGNSTETVMLNDLYSEKGVTAEFVDSSGNITDITDQVKVYNYVNMDKEGVYIVKYKIQYQGSIDYEISRLVIVATDKWLQYIATDPIAYNSDISGIIIKRLEQMFWDLSNKIDNEYSDIDARLRQARDWTSSWSFYEDLNILDFNINLMSFVTTIPFEVGNKFKLINPPKSSWENQIFQVSRIKTPNAWNSYSVYEQYDVVYYNGKSYKAISQNSNEFPSISDNWVLAYAFVVSTYPEGVYVSWAEEDLTSNDTVIQRYETEVGYNGYVFTSNISDNIDFEEPPIVRSIWSNDESYIQSELVIYKGTGDEYEYYRRLDAEPNLVDIYESTPPSSSNPLWKISDWKTLEKYPIQTGYLQRVGTLNIDNVKNYMISLGIPEALINDLQRTGISLHSISKLTYYILQTRGTIEGLNVLLQVLGFTVNTNVQRTSSEDQYYCIKNSLLTTCTHTEASSYLYNEIYAGSTYTLKGNFVLGTVYDVNDVVTNGNSIYIAKVGSQGVDTSNDTYFKEVWRIEYLNSGNNSYYELDITLEDFQSIGNVVEGSGGIIRILDDELQSSMSKILGDVLMFEIPDFITLNAYLFFESRFDRHRIWWASTSTLQGRSEAMVPPYSVTFNVGFIGNNYYLVGDSLDEFLIGRGEIYADNIPIDQGTVYEKQVLETLNLFAIANPNYNFVRWEVSGIGTVYDSSDVDINGSTTSYLGNVYVANGNVLIRAMFKYN